MRWDIVGTMALQVLFGASIISFGLYMIFKKNITFRLWVSLIPGLSVLVIGTSIGTMMVESHQTLIGGVLKAAPITLMNIGIVLASFIIVGNGIIKKVDENILIINQAAESIADASKQVSVSSQDLAQGSSEQAASVEETASSLEEMTAMVQMNAENARQANIMSVEANQSASEGVVTINSVANAIKEIKTSSDSTFKIIKTIDEIAFQTNLLALNAAVEAARAGEAGKGFAVVAEEVRNLARRSAEAAKSTGDIIEGSKKNVDVGVAMIDEVNIIFQTIGDKVGKVANLVSEVSTANEEQSRGIEQLNSAASEMEKVTQRNSSNSEETAAASEELTSQATELKEVIKGLQDYIQGSKKVIRYEHKSYEDHGAEAKVSAVRETKNNNGHNGSFKINAQELITF